MGAVDASSEHTAFYAMMLSITTGKCWRAYTHILTSRSKREVVLDAKRLQALWDASVRLEQLAVQEAVPVRLCQTCSLAMFCGFD